MQFKKKLFIIFSGGKKEKKNRKIWIQWLIILLNLFFEKDFDLFFTYYIQYVALFCLIQSFEINFLHFHLFSMFRSAEDKIGGDGDFKIQVKSVENANTTIAFHSVYWIISQIIYFSIFISNE